MSFPGRRPQSWRLARRVRATARTPLAVAAAAFGGIAVVALVDVGQILHQGKAFAWAGRPLSSTGGASLGRIPRFRACATARSALVDDEDDLGDTFDQPIEDLALDVRELLITDGCISFVGPDVESYDAEIREVAQLLNYTHHKWDYPTWNHAAQDLAVLQRVYPVPPVKSTQRWPWPMIMNGLVVWIDPDGYKKLDVFERERIRKLQFPKQPDPYGPRKTPDVLKKDPEPLGDPVEMWSQADVHVNTKNRTDIPLTNRILACIIDHILENPPRWRQWMKECKFKGSVPQNFETPLQIRRSMHSYGISPRLNKLLNA